MRRLRQCRNLVGSRCRRLPTESGPRPRRAVSAPSGGARQSPASSLARGPTVLAPPRPCSLSAARGSLRSSSSAAAPNAAPNSKQRSCSPTSRPSNKTSSRELLSFSSPAECESESFPSADGSARVSVRWAEQMTRVAYASLSRTGGCGRRAATTSNRARAPRWPRFRPGLPAPRPETHSTNDVQLVFVDLRGQGRSSPAPVEACTLEQMADDAAALCSLLGLEAPVVFGHSAGGFVALHLALRHPTLPASLILCDSAPTLRASAGRRSAGRPCRTSRRRGNRRRATIVRRRPLSGDDRSVRPPRHPLLRRACAP